MSEPTVGGNGYRLGDTYLIVLRLKVEQRLGQRSPDFSNDPTYQQDEFRNNPFVQVSIVIVHWQPVVEGSVGM